MIHQIDAKVENMTFMIWREPMPMPVLSILFIASQKKSRITCHYVFYTVITLNNTDSLLASGK
jgi:hypothetical protein